ncbi:AAA family ATPase [Streptomyces diastaticus]|uniref:AAA family ATPase n=1 Tax=Streptomyces diastaticus TaxID=1956 RepID=UPI003661B33F
MIVAVGGRPFTGKSTLARALADALSGVLLDTTTVRKAFFPTVVEAPPEVTDWLYEGLLKAASWTLDTTPGAIIVLDGRPLTRNRDVLALQRFAAHVGHMLQLIECVCPADVAAERSRSAATEAGGLPAGTADNGTDPIPEPKVVVDTSHSLERCVSAALDGVGPFLSVRGAGPAAARSAPP